MNINFVTLGWSFVVIAMAGCLAGIAGFMWLVWSVEHLDLEKIMRDEAEAQGYQDAADGSFVWVKPS